MPDSRPAGPSSLKLRGVLLRSRFHEIAGSGPVGTSLVIRLTLALLACVFTGGLNAQELPVLRVPPPGASSPRPATQPQPVVGQPFIYGQPIISSRQITPLPPASSTIIPRSQSFPNPAATAQPAAPLPYTARYSASGDSLEQAFVVVEIGEDAVNRLLGGIQLVQSGPVHERILGADVRGSQQLFAQLSTDFQRSSNQWQIWLVLNGSNFSETVGMTPEASVSSSSVQHFQVAKPLILDGRRFGTRQPVGSVLPQTMNHAAWTPLGGVPLLGPIANGIALQAAESRKTQANTEAATLLMERLKPQFNSQVDRILASGNRTMVAWEQAGPQTIPPRDTVQMESYDRGARLTVFSQDGFSPQPGSMPDASERRQQFRLQLHESAVQAFLNRLPLAGQTIPDTLTANLERDIVTPETLPGLLLDLPKRWDELTRLAPKVAQLRLAESDPVQLQIRDQKITLTIIARVEPIVGEPLDEQRIEMAWQLSETGDDYITTPLPIEVSRADGQAAGLTERIAQNLLKQEIFKLFESQTFRKVRRVDLPGVGSFAWHWKHLAMNDGWLQLVLEPQPVTPLAAGLGVPIESSDPLDGLPVPSQFSPPFLTPPEALPR